jgi:4-hydroxybenzoate polyprenyltransferase
MAAFAFSLTSSIVYIINDIADQKNDRLHPVKKLRPVASGSISHSFAFATIFVILIIITPIIINFDYYFILTLLGYFVLNTFYSFVFKQVVILDLMCIAAGFMLRIIGGALVIDVYISNWLILTTLFLSLFLAIMKRRSEVELMTNNNSTRFVLKDYSIDFINQISAITASGVIIYYALYTVSDRTVAIFGTENLVFTTIFFIFGILRYMFIVYTQNKGENTIEIIFKDIPMIINAILYAGSILLFVYY